MRQVHWALLAAVVALCVSAIADDEDIAVHPSAFHLDLKRPDHWYSAAYPEIPDRVVGLFLGGWIDDRVEPQACIYLLGVRKNGEQPLRYFLRPVLRQFSSIGASPKTETGLTVLGRPAVSIFVTGKGNGMALNGMIHQGPTGDIDTWMKILAVKNYLPEPEPVTECVMIVTSGPESRWGECVTALSQVVNRAQITGGEAVADGEAETDPEILEPPPKSSPAAQTQPAPTVTARVPRLRFAGSAPDGWQSVPEGRLPHRLGGEYVSGWMRSTQHGNCCAYVAVLTLDGHYLLGQVADAVKDTFARMDLEPEVRVGVEALGATGIMLGVTGKGNGLAFNAMIPEEKDRRDMTTAMDLLVVLKPYQAPEAKTDIIQFVASGPLQDRTRCRRALEHVVASASLSEVAVTRSSAATAPSATAAEPADDRAVSPTAEEKDEGVQLAEVRAAAGEDEASGGSDETQSSDARPLPDASENSGGAASKSVPISNTARRDVKGVVGTLQKATDGEVVTHPLHILPASSTKLGEFWAIAADAEPDTIFILLAQDMSEAWILSFEDVKQLAEPVGNTLLLAQSEDLDEFKNNWQDVLEPGGGSPQ